MPAAPLEQQVAMRARRDTRFAQVLTTLLEAPTTPRGTLERVAAGSLNEQRLGALVHDFVDGALPTSDVQARLRLRTPQAVHRLRTRGKLIGKAVGNQTYFPAWQFDGDQIRTDLPRILELIGRFTNDPLAADRVMRLEHADLGGKSIAHALRLKKSVDQAWQTLTALGA
jgi:hypothetical protein